MKDKSSNIPIIIVCLILAIFFIFILITLFNTKNIRDNTEPNYELQNSQIDVYKEKKSNYIVANPVIKKEIASYKTKILDNEENRIYNIKLACKNLNETIIKSGEEFSFNNKLGDMGPNEGYKKATGFDSYGNNIKVYGGGICQLSSTLYNAVLIAKLEVTERHAHSKRVYYVPKNKDATVFAGGPDLKFINTSDNDITINSSTDGYTVTVALSQYIK